jgi:hypothetical protein
MAPKTPELASEANSDVPCPQKGCQAIQDLVVKKDQQHASEATILLEKNKSAMSFVHLQVRY